MITKLELKEKVFKIDNDNVEKEYNFLKTKFQKF